MANASRADENEPASGDRFVPYSGRTWQTDEGLPQNFVQAIAQSGDGYLWVGTREGLARFDGLRFVTFDPKNTPELKHHSITALCGTRDGSVWIGTEEGGLSRWHNGTFSHLSQTNTEHIRALFEGPDGTLWIGAREGLFCQKGETFFQMRQGENFFTTTVRQISSDTHSNIWLVTDVGVSVVQNGIVTNHPLTNALLNRLVKTIYVDAQDTIWLGTVIGLFTEKAGALTPFTEEQGLPGNLVTTMLPDKRNNFWLGASSGLYRYSNERFMSQPNNEGEDYGLINVLFEDREGNLWIGAREGLTRLRPRQFFTYTRQHGLANNNVMSVLEDKTGKVWMGTWGGGLNVLDQGKIVVQPMTGIGGVSGDLVLAMLDGSDGSFWFGLDYDGGLIQMKDGQMTRYWQGHYDVADPAVRVLHEDRSDNLWIGTRTALIRLAKTSSGWKTTRFTTTESLAGNLIQAICEDHEGRLWIGTDGGLSRFADEKFVNLRTNDGLSANNITALFEDAEGTLWIGTRQGGLNWLRNGKFSSVSAQAGLFDDNILEVIEDDAGCLWMTCLKGIFKVQKRSLEEFAAGKVSRITSISYGRSDGLASTQCNGVAKPAAWKGRDGRLWFATTKGVVVTDPHSGVDLGSSPPQVVMEKIIADKKEIGRQEKEREKVRMRESEQSHSPTFPPAHLLISPGHGELEFQFTAFDFRAPDQIRFKYRLEGIDADWVDAGTRRVAHYNNIYPGHYRFRVAAANREGIWNETGAEVGIVLQPHFWQTWWFIGFVVIGAAGLIAGTARYITWRNLRRQLERMEQQHALEKERARIAQDIHDDLGAGLTRITMLSDFAEVDRARPDEVQTYTQKISSTARDMVRSLDEIVWAVSPKNDSLRSLVEYLGLFADDFLGDTAIRCWVERPSEIPMRPISADVRHNLFLVFKETLNNAAKHSGASEIKIKLSADEKRLHILIVDNGKGFDFASREGSGNGLENMRERISEVGGRFEISSTPGKGTRTEMEIPVESSVTKET